MVGGLKLPQASKITGWYNLPLSNSGHANVLRTGARGLSADADLLHHQLPDMRLLEIPIALTRWLHGL